MIVCFRLDIVITDQKKRLVLGLEISIMMYGTYFSTPSKQYENWNSLEMPSL